ncbi:MAG: hypothetical protein AVDCRST_MAG66-3836, partial [uncultured Pseudonocardia sp.]
CSAATPWPCWTPGAWCSTARACGWPPRRAR